MTTQTRPAIRAAYDSESFKIYIVSGKNPIGEIPASHVLFLAETSDVRTGPLSEFAAGPLTAALQNVYNGVDTRGIERDNPESFELSTRDYRKGGEFVTVTATDHFSKVSQAIAFNVHNEEALTQALQSLPEETRQQRHNEHVPVHAPASELYE
ncbi:MAG: hypothetical protein WBK55_06830 [Alphaproteobacteria bacterium]